MLEVRSEIKTIAEGFAVFDFVQGHVATELPTALAADIVCVLHGSRLDGPDGPARDLVLLWLEHYRRAYSHMIMRVLEDGADSVAV